MDARLIVHIGPPKTGSSSLQFALHGLRSELERLGIHLPVAGRAAHTCCHNRLVTGGDSSGRLWARLGGAVRRSRARCVVVSSELFAHPSGYDCVERIRHLAASSRRSLTVVAYVRPQYQLLESRYSQVVRDGTAWLPFECYRETPNGRRLDYNVILGPWREAFGDRLCVHPVEPSRLPHGVAAHFLGLLGVSVGDERLPRVNRRADARETEVRRMVSERVRDATPARKRPIARRLALLPALLDGHLPFAPLEPEGIATMNARFAAANAQFAREFGIDATGILFRDLPHDRFERPGRAEWDDLDAIERRRIGQFVRDVAGVDLEAPAPDPALPGPISSLGLVRWGLHPRVAGFLTRRAVRRRREAVALARLRVGAVGP